MDILPGNLNEALLPTSAATSTRPRQGSEARAGGRLRVRPIARDLALTMATEFSILVAGVALVSLIGRLLGPESLGAYLLVRRVTQWLITGVLLGMGYALPRYIANSVKKPEAERHAYFLAGSACLLTGTTLAAILLWFERQTVARWLFGSVRFESLVLPLGLLLAGLAFEAAPYGYYRGEMAMGRANLLQFVHFAVIPVAAVLLMFPTGSVVLILDLIGGATMLAAVLLAWPICRKIAAHPLPKIKPYVTELLRYGLGRVPGDFGGAALFALGPLVAAHYVSMVQVGYLLLGSSFLMVMGYATGPLGVILLSKISMMLAQDRNEEVRASLQHLIGAALDLSIFATLQLVVLTDLLIRIWVGPRFLEATTVTRLLLLAIPPYLLFMALRSSIDAATVKPRNAGNVLVALGIFVALVVVTVHLFPVTSVLNAIAGSLVVALAALSLLTVRTFKQLYKVTVPWRRCARSVIAAVLLGGVGFGFRWMEGFGGPIFLVAVVEIGIVVAYLGVLLKLDSPWLGFLWQMAFSDRRGDEATA